MSDESYDVAVIGAGGMVALAVAVWIGTLIPGLSTTHNSQPVSQPLATNAEIMPLQADSVSNESVVMVSAGSGEEVLQQLQRPVEEYSQEVATTLLQQRLSDTEKWFGEVPDNHYSIQLFMTNLVDVAAVEDFLQNAPEMLDFEEIYIYETVINDREMYSVLYGDYASRAIARSKLENLPASLLASQPFLRRVSTFRKATARNS